MSASVPVITRWRGGKPRSPQPTQHRARGAPAPALELEAHRCPIFVLVSEDVAHAHPCGAKLFEAVTGYASYSKAPVFGRSPLELMWSDKGGYQITPVQATTPAKGQGSPRTTSPRAPKGKPDKPNSSLTHVFQLCSRTVSWQVPPAV